MLKSGALGDPTSNSVESGFCIAQGYVLDALCEVGVKLVKDSARETNVVLKTV